MSSRPTAAKRWHNKWRASSRWPTSSGNSRRLRTFSATLGLPTAFERDVWFSRDGPTARRYAYESGRSEDMAPDTLVHADLKPEHVLHDHSCGEITAVLDWGDAGLSHADFELAVIGLFFDTDVRDEVWLTWIWRRGVLLATAAPSVGPLGTEGSEMGATGIDEAKLEAFMGQAFTDIGAIISAPLVVIGEKLGLYKAMAHAGPLSSAQVAERSGTAERSVREWLGNQAAGGYVTYDPDSDRYTLPDEHALALADEDSPFYVLGIYDMFASLYADEDKIVEAFRTGTGMGWHEHDHRLFRATERFFRPGYRAHLVAEWIPALDGVKDKLDRGAKVADVGCGHGASTVIMASAFPNSEFVGFDYHDASIERAREVAREAGVGDRVSFEVASAQDYPGSEYDLVCVFDCLHDMGDPVGASEHVLQTLDADGTWMIVEPFANDRVRDNLNPVGRVFYGASTVICTPASLAQDVGLALGAQAGEARLTEVLKQGGFTRVRRATETPFNLVLEAKP